MQNELSVADFFAFGNAAAAHTAALWPAVDEPAAAAVDRVDDTEEPA